MMEPIPHVMHPLVGPHDDHHYFAADRQAETDSLNFDRRRETRTRFCTDFNAVGSQGSAITVGPVRPALSSRDELLPAR